MNHAKLSRRDWLRLSAAGVMAYSMSGWLEALAAGAAADPKRKRACILLWMNGGPSQMDTFDLKPGHANGGPYKEIKTSTPDLRISEHLPRIARFGDRLAVIRSMSTKEGEHQRATFLMRTGYQPTGPIQYPTLGSLVSKELGADDAPLPNFVSIGPFRFFNPAAYGPGFLGPQYAPLIIGDGNRGFQQQGQSYEQALKVQDIDLPGGVDRAHAGARIDLLEQMESDFISEHPGVAPLSHKTAYDRAVKLMRTDANKAFNLEEESPMLRDAYGRNLFGQGCLLARRLVERGVPFVEVTLAGVSGNNVLGWDTHQRNFESVRRLSEVLDPAWGTLMEDLKQRGLLDSTLIVWMGEFGRTPKINPQQGRDHFPGAWSTVLAGGGIKGGQAYGKTSADGMKVETRPTSVGDFLATVCLVLGIDPRKQNNSNVGRPIRIADKDAQPIKEIVA
ncbi:MAG TPA: DUF1501 domain-containing protein [Gemmataceae bacterium]|jgi:hypothetical protein